MLATQINAPVVGMDIISVQAIVSKGVLRIALLAQVELLAPNVCPDSPFLRKMDNSSAHLVSLRVVHVLKVNLHRV